MRRYPAGSGAPSSLRAPQGYELERSLDPARADELRREASSALREARELLAGLDDETRRERREAVSTVEDLLEQGREALAEDDVTRAHNLARKALTLAREL